jgi:hypothetical protein
LIVIGYKIMPQINDGVAAALLQNKINEKGRNNELRFASIVTDRGLLENSKFMRCPLISLGGPNGNEITARLANELLMDPSSSEYIHIQHNIEKKIPQVLLWGSGNLETERAVDIFISSGLLEKFLNMVWGEQSPPMGFGFSSSP